MRCRSCFLMLLSLGISLALAIPVNGQVNLFRKSQSPQNLELTQDQGPWLIMCASFVGEAGEQQARQLADELRRDFGLEAWLYRHQFDYSDKIHALGWDPPANGQGLPVPKQLKPAHIDRFEEVAVVVGSFPSLDDNRAQETLEQIKHLRPRTLELREYVRTNQRMGVLRDWHKNISSDPEARKKGQMGSAFLMPNPFLPEEYFQTRTLDKVLVKLNKGVKHSLIECPGNFSVKVATFRGDQTFNNHEIYRKQQEFQALQESGKPLTESKLAEAGVKAHLLCTALRKKGIEAWEFHDHHESYVCVGSFEWASEPVDYGPDHLNPEIADVIRQFKAAEFVSNGVTAMRPRTLEVFQGTGIDFDAQPLPVAVPKLAVARKRGLFRR